MIYCVEDERNIRELLFIHWKQQDLKPEVLAMAMN